MCGSNGNQRNGLELHHILGRVSDSIFNCACLCGTCHSHMGHSREEHQQLFGLAVHFIKAVHYAPDDDDLKFVAENFEELVSQETKMWIMDLA